jgi:hypothetical protein
MIENMRQGNGMILKLKNKRKTSSIPLNKAPKSAKEKRRRELWLNKDVYKNDRCSSTFFTLKNHHLSPRRKNKLNFCSQEQIAFSLF